MRAQLTLGIDGEALRRPLSGVGRYVYAICAELERMLRNVELLAYSRLPEAALDLPSARWRVRQEPRQSLRRLPSFAWLKSRGRELCIEDGVQVFWAGRTLHPSLPSPAITVSTVHDLNHLIVPATMQWSTRISHALWFESDVRSARRVIANSQGTAERLQRMLSVSVAGVVQPGLEASFRAQPGGVDDDKRVVAALGARAPYILALATSEPRKNLVTLVRAFQRLRKAGALRDFQLVLAGSRGWNNAALEDALAACDEGSVVRCGYVDDAAMPALYRRAELLVMPSLYEGFGMPVLEARACGTRVVVSDIPELRESGGPHATLVNPTVDSLQRGILKALARSRHTEPGLAEIFSWHGGATNMLHHLGLAEHSAGAREHVFHQERLRAHR